MKSIVILHFRPPKLYPPLLNFLSYLEERNIRYKLVTAKEFNSKNVFFRFLSVLDFFINGSLSTFFHLGPIICYESISASGLFASSFLKRKQDIYFHYHEYFSIEEYKRESFLERLGLKLEKSILKKALWISHTNYDRLEKWSNENPCIQKEKLGILPNYPPKKWTHSKPKENYTHEKIRLLHIGALSLNTMYLKEVLDMIGGDPRFSLDFYSHIISRDVHKEIDKHANCFIKGAIDYNKIPLLRNNYDVGLVLYNASTLNFKYNAPNKIFEYLSLGLDVWCSDKLISAKQYECVDTYPKMILVDFTRFNQFDVSKARSIEGLSYSPSPYHCEEVFDSFVEKIFQVKR
jgi:hypothetical protein